MATAGSQKQRFFDKMHHFGAKITKSVLFSDQEGDSFRVALPILETKRRKTEQRLKK
jgi:hypothetical protein